MAAEASDDAGTDAAVIERRIRKFTELQEFQNRRYKEIGGESIRITLQNGTVRDGKKWLTTPEEIAKDIGKEIPIGIPLVAKVNDVLWDLKRPLEGDCRLLFFNFDSKEGRDTFWHSSAHILGQSLEQLYGCQLCIGPCSIREEGFFYDAFYGKKTLSEKDLEVIDKQVAKAVKERKPFERIEVSKQQALDLFSANRFKIEIAEDLPADATITVYRCGSLVDLCRGPHIPYTSHVKAMKCLKASACYWRGERDRDHLQRVYGISYQDKKELKEYITRLEEAKKRDHRKLGEQDQLFTFHECSPGSAFFLPKGTIVYNKLVELIRSEYKKRGFKEVVTPNTYNMKLWEQSGHAENYKKNMFVFKVEDEEFGLKPMNCPGHCLMYKQMVRSYKDLPLRLADFGVLHRNELSGALSGLTRVRRFSQDDAHIFCRESQAKDEVVKALDFMKHVYDIFGFTYELGLSRRPAKFLGEIETWDRAEQALADALNAHGLPWKDVPNEDGAFYGPKIDINVFDAYKRKFQCATIQLDFQLPIRFDLKYTSEDEASHRPVIIHRAILGSVERMFAILLEHYGGHWPFWLSPRQAIICTISQKFNEYGLEVQKLLKDAGFDADVSMADRSVNYKVHDALVSRYEYILVVGEREAKDRKVDVRLRSMADSEKLISVRRGQATIDDLIAEFQELVKNYKPLEEKTLQPNSLEALDVSKDHLFMYHEWSPNNLFLLPQGAIVYNKLLDLIRIEYKERDFKEVISPNMYNRKLWEQSGHAEYCKEDMLVFQVDEQKYVWKSTNCPGHCLMYKNLVQSYRDLPLRLAEFGVLYRNHTRLTQDDAYIFCRESQAKDEVEKALDFVKHVYDICGFTYELGLSRRPVKFLGDTETWEKAEQVLADSLNAHGLPWKHTDEDGAFYGPMIVIKVFDALKREFHCAAIQLNFQLPIGFDLKYQAEGEASERPVIIHRAILGSVERMAQVFLGYYEE